MMAQFSAEWTAWARLHPTKGEWVMQLISVTAASTNGQDAFPADIAIANWLTAAARGDANACFDLGVAFSTCGNGTTCDFVEAHKWFNLAASRGHEEAAHSRSELAEEMTAREIAEAQRRARQWLADERREAA